MEEDWSRITEKIWSLTLEMIFLLTREAPPIKFGDHLTIAMSPPPSPTPEKRTMQKILKVTDKITELLTGEVPVRCDEVTIHLSMEEWEYLEGHPELYRNAIMADQAPPPSPEVSRDFSEKSPRPLYSQDSTQEVTPHHYQSGIGEVELVSEDLCPTEVANYFHKDIKMERSSCWEAPERCLLGDDGASVVETGMRIIEHCKDGEEFPVIDAAGHYISRNTTMHPDVIPGWKIEADEITADSLVGNLINRNLHPEYHSAGSSSNLVGQWGCIPVPPHTAQSRKAKSQQENCTGEKPFSCFECGKCFARKSEFIRHERDHTREKPYTCSVCGKCFSYKSVFMRHERVHTGEKPYSCSQCGKGFAQKITLILHERVHTGEKPYSCSECGKAFSYKTSLVLHEKLHKGEKPYACSYCEKSFSYKTSLMLHETFHTGNLPYSCSVCGKSFSQRSKIIKHERAHTGEKPYSCSVCGKSFFQKSDSVRHEKVHTRERPHSCSECGKSFSDKSALSRHERVHTGEKPYSCSECGKSFSRKSALNRHERVHTGEIHTSDPSAVNIF